MTADSTDATDATDATVAAIQRRTLRVLSAAQVLGGLGVGAGAAVGGLVAEGVSGSTALAGLAQTSTVLGAAVAAVPMARLMSARGRRPGLVSGYVGAVLGSVLVVLGAEHDSFALVIVGLLLLGSGTATNLQSRYAATDLATPAHRARALGTVVWATTVGVVLGPNLSGPGGAVGHWLGIPELAGPLVFSALSFGLAAAVVAAGLRPDPLLHSRRTSGSAAVRSGPAPTFADSLRTVGRSRPATVALVALALAHAVMVSVMAMTPVHMRHEGASLQVVGLVISAHVAGMFAFSPVVGWLADRFGRVEVIALGQLLLVAAVVVAGTAPEEANVALGLGLLLLGLGWSCALVAGSTLLSESVDDRARPGVQGAADFVMGAVGAMGGAVAGVVVAGPGYGVLNALAGLLVGPVVLLVLGLRRAQPLTH